MSDKTMTVMVGIPGSGKSYEIDNNMKGNDLQIVCADDVRASLGHEFNHKAEPIVHAMCDQMTRGHLERGSNVVIDSTNVHYNIVQKYIKLANEYNYKTVAVIMNIDVNVCKKNRETWGEEKVEKVINRMKKNYDDITKDDFEFFNKVFDEVEIINELK